MTVIPLATDLRINNKSDALSLDKNHLRFSWQIPLTLNQTAYRLTFAQGQAELDSERYLFDTGWIKSKDSAAVAVEGLGDALEQGRGYVWRVSCTYDTAGAIPFHSAPARFTTAPPLSDTRGLWSGSVDGRRDQIGRAHV